MSHGHHQPFAHEPWFLTMLDAAALTRGARVLQFGVSDPAQCSAVLARIDPGGELTVIEPDAARAARIDELNAQGLGLLAYEVRGDERLGMHDVAIAAPERGPLPRIETCLQLVGHNLRPGGRLVFDLAAQPSCDMLSAALREAGAPEAAIAAIDGLPRAELERLVKPLPLRRVEVAEMLSLVRFHGTREAALHAVHLCGPTLASDHGDLANTVALILTSRLETIDVVEIPFRRLRITGMR